LTGTLTTLLTTPQTCGSIRSVPGSVSVAPRLSRAVILDACLEIADQDGPDAITMRRLGTALGVDPTAVYRHFRDKDELLRALADRLLVDAAATLKPSGSWRDDLINIALTARSAYLAHPQLAHLLATATPPLPNSERLTEAALGALRAAGLDDMEAATAYQVFENFVVGSSSLDALGSTELAEIWRRTFAVLPKDSYPHLTDAAPLLYRDPEHVFRYGLDLLLDALEARLQRRRDDP
jgi:TetR/AcrR family tetracycline transcriptional repressor